MASSLASKDIIGLASVGRADSICKEYSAHQYNAPTSLTRKRSAKASKSKQMGNK